MNATPMNRPEIVLLLQPWSTAIAQTTKSRMVTTARPFSSISPSYLFSLEIGLFCCTSAGHYSDVRHGIERKEELPGRIRTLLATCSSQFCSRQAVHIRDTAKQAVWDIWESSDRSPTAGIDRKRNRGGIRSRAGTGNRHTDRSWTEATPFSAGSSLENNVLRGTQIQRRFVFGRTETFFLRT